MKKLFTLFVLAVTLILPGFAQNNVGINTATPDASAALDVNSTTQGILIPRMTKAQRDVINIVDGRSTPATGLLIYQTDDLLGFYAYDGSAWTAVTNSSAIAIPEQSGQEGKVLTTDGSNVSWANKDIQSTYIAHITQNNTLYHSIYTAFTSNSINQYIPYYTSSNLKLTIDVVSYVGAAYTLELWQVKPNNTSSTFSTMGLQPLAAVSIAPWTGSGSPQINQFTYTLTAGELYTLKTNASSVGGTFFVKATAQ